MISTSFLVALQTSRSLLSDRETSEFSQDQKYTHQHKFQFLQFWLPENVLLSFPLEYDDEFFVCEFISKQSNC